MPWKDKARRYADSERHRQRQADQLALLSPTRADCPVCGRPFKSSGSLAQHRAKLSPCLIPDIERFWQFADRTGDCWLWTGPVFTDGYPQFWFRGRGRRATRWIWEHLNGPIPKGLFVCHTCDRPLCVRPEHHWLGTGGENARDAAVKGRLKRPRVM